MSLKQDTHMEHPEKTFCNYSTINTTNATKPPFFPFLFNMKQRPDTHLGQGRVSG